VTHYLAFLLRAQPSREHLSVTVELRLEPAEPEAVDAAAHVERSQSAHLGVDLVAQRLRRLVEVAGEETVVLHLELLDPAVEPVEPAVELVFDGARSLSRGGGLRADGGGGARRQRSSADGRALRAGASGSCGGSRSRAVGRSLRRCRQGLSSLDCIPARRVGRRAGLRGVAWSA
jgi:hypothetical protein